MDQKLKARVISEWRGLPGKSPKPNRSRKIGKVLQAVLRKLELTERLEEVAVLEAWREIAGDFFAQHSTPLRFKKGVLYIQVFQPSIHYELDRTWKPRFLGKFQEKFGRKTIREIRF